MERKIPFYFCYHRWRCSSIKMFWFLLCFLSIWNRVTKLDICLIHVVIWQKKKCHKRLLILPLHFFYRLDRLTSGLLLFGRNPKKAREMEQQIRTRQVQKEYVCRVEGEFPTWVNSPETKLIYLQKYRVTLQFCRKGGGDFVLLGDNRGVRFGVLKKVECLPSRGRISHVS